MTGRPWAIAVAAWCVAASCGDTPGDDTTGAIVYADFLLGRGNGTYERSIHDPIVIECMQQAGFMYTPPSPSAAIDINSREYAQTYGFGTITAQQQTIEIADADHAVNPPEAFATNLQTCEDQAVGVVAEERSRMMELVPNELVAEIQQLATGTHPDLTDVEAKWSTCMKQRGWIYSNPTAASEDFATRAGDITPGTQAFEDFRAEEIRVAVANYDCRVESGINGIVDRILTSINQAITNGQDA